MGRRLTQNQNVPVGLLLAPFYLMPQGLRSKQQVLSVPLTDVRSPSTGTAGYKNS